MTPSRTLRIRHGTRELILVRSGSPVGTEGHERLSAEQATTLVTSWGADATRALRGLPGLLGRPAVDSRSAISLSALTQALRQGDVRAYRRTVPFGPPTMRGETIESEPTTAPTKKKTWIAIEVVDDRKPARPVVGLRWRITLPDGEVREGRTDKDGKARIDGIADGVGEVTFPDVDGGEWKPL